MTTGRKGRAGRFALGALAGLLAAGVLRADEVRLADAPAANAGLRDRVEQLLRNGRHGEAVELARRARNEGMAEAHAALLLGWALQECGRSADALPHLEAATAGLPDEPRAWNNLACALLDLGRDDAAAKALERARSLGASLGEVHNNHGILLDRMGRTDEAESAFREALRREPGLARAHNNLGALLFETRRDADAMKHFTEAARIDPKYASPRINLGVMALDRGDTVEAERILREEAARPGARPEAQFNLSLLALRRGDFDLSRASLEQALARRPEDPDILNNLGVTHIMLKEYRSAEGYLLRAVKGRPDFAQAWANLGLAQHHLAVEADSDDRLLERAEQSFQKETELRPEGPWGWFNLGTVRLARSRIVEAEAAFRRALELAPANAEALNNLGCVLDLSIENRPADPLAALHCYQDALVVDPDYADAHRNLGTWYATTEGHIDHEKALHHWRMFLRLSAGDAVAQDEARINIAAIKKAQYESGGNENRSR